MVAMSDFSTFSQMTYEVFSMGLPLTAMVGTSYWDAVGILLSNAFGFCLALLKGMLVLELGAHNDRRKR